MLATVFYAWLAIWTLIRELGSLILDPGHRWPSTGVSRRAAVGLAMLCALWLVGRLIGHLFVARSSGPGPEVVDAGAAPVIDAVAWSTLLLPLAFVAMVSLLVHLLRWHYRSRGWNV